MFCICLHLPKVSEIQSMIVRYGNTSFKIKLTLNYLTNSFYGPYFSLMTTFRAKACSKKDELQDSLKLDNDALPKNNSVKRNKQRTMKGTLYLTDSYAARVVAEHIRQNTSDFGYVFQANPGAGFLTKVLLENKVSHVRVFEKEGRFLPDLKELADAYPNLEIIQSDLMALPKLAIREYFTGKSITEEFFHGIQEQPWNGDIPITILAVVSNTKGVKFLRFLQAKLSTMSSIFSFGRCQFFLILSEAEYTTIMAKPKENLSNYRGATILYNLYFDISCIDKIPAKCFIPMYKSSHKSSEFFYFTHLSPKIDIFETVAAADKLPELHYFVLQYLAKRTSRVIPSLEKRIDFCGSRLIKEGSKISTKFGDLSPAEILNVFKQFSSWPEYVETNFPAEAHDYFHNYTISDDEHA